MARFFPPVSGVRCRRGSELKYICVFLLSFVQLHHGPQSSSDRGRPLWSDQHEGLSGGGHDANLFWKQRWHWWTLEVQGKSALKLSKVYPQSFQRFGFLPFPVIKNLFSAGSVRAKQGQHLPFPHHQHLQGDDELQRLPRPSWLPQLHAPLKNPELL